jgi:co-chaperonin GroES (HSP10)
MKYKESFKNSDMRFNEDQDHTYLTDGSSRQIRKVHPLGMRVLIRIRRNSNQTEAGLYLPEGSKDSMQESLVGEVIEVATAQDEDEEEANISGIPLGATVLIPKDAGVKIPWDGDLRIVETSAVLALVSEVSLS